jgi:hypothetical protein
MWVLLLLVFSGPRSARSLGPCISTSLSTVSLRLCPENGRSMLLRYVGNYLPDSMRSLLRRRPSFLEACMSLPVEYALYVCGRIHILIYFQVSSKCSASTSGCLAVCLSACCTSPVSAGLICCSVVWISSSYTSIIEREYLIRAENLIVTISFSI